MLFVLLFYIYIYIYIYIFFFYYCFVILHYYTYYIRQVINTLESTLYLNDDYLYFIIIMQHCHSRMIITIANYKKTSGSVLAWNNTIPHRFYSN